MQRLILSMMAICLTLLVYPLYGQDAPVINASVPYPGGNQIFTTNGQQVPICSGDNAIINIVSDVTCAQNQGVDERFFVRKLAGGFYEPFVLGAGNTLEVSIPTFLRYCVRCNDGVMKESDVFFFVPKSQLNGVSCSSILPVGLADFSGVKTASGIQLTWSTESEENNDGFEVMHSTDGRNWEILEFVYGSGTSVDHQQYDYLHKTQRPGRHYFRLKQIDFDGSYEFSRIIEVSNSAAGAVETKVFPNPASDHFTISMNNPLRENAIIKVMDLTGRVVFAEVLSNDLATDYWAKTFTALNQQTYFVMFNIGGEITTQKVHLMGSY